MPFDRSPGTLHQPTSHFDNTGIDINAYDFAGRANGTSNHPCSDSRTASHIEHVLS